MLLSHDSRPIISNHRYLVSWFVNSAVAFYSTTGSSSQSIGVRIKGKNATQLRPLAVGKVGEEWRNPDFDFFLFKKIF